MKVELISVGTELLLGHVINSNAAFLAKECYHMGLPVYHQSVVGDNYQDLMQQLTHSALRSDIIILTGGLGPTEDDMTKECCSQFTKRPLVYSQAAKAVTQNYFEKIGKKPTYHQDKQWMILEGSEVLPNPNGTACGLYLEMENLTLILLPGPPNEMKPMFMDFVRTRLSKGYQKTFATSIIKLRGLPESIVEEKIADLIQDKNGPRIGTYASTQEVHVAIMTEKATYEEANTVVLAYTKQVLNRFENYVLTTDSKDIVDIILDILIQRNWHISFAESCSGGLLAESFISHAGCSQVINESYITYSNEAKERLVQVSNETLKKYGAVSKETAIEMAKGVAMVSNSEVGCSITGIAGPGGETPEKPVGLVYIACYINGKCTSKGLQLTGNRQKIREGAVAHLLTLLWQELQ